MKTKPNMIHCHKWYICVRERERERGRKGGETEILSGSQTQRAPLSIDLCTLPVNGWRHVVYLSP